ncbi:hypothetical protein [uncultured Roseivirga sp.]|uniref:hypothetical protein n=1 Tax=uncultured Roseivirga sp. TaxID=543088 RepID=UPI0030D8B1D8|tara:strand:- start:39160 stop:39369 length:210 start_codon:yes stop_codon:yes gene_type:complete
MKKIMPIVLFVLFSVQNVYGTSCATSTNSGDNINVCVENVDGESVCLPSWAGEGDPPKCMKTIWVPEAE